MFTKVLPFIISILVLTASIRGIWGIPTAEQLNTPVWNQEGPFELSPERGRYALTYSLVINKSPHFSVPIARFAIPDLGYIGGKYVSLFAPGVSYLVIPGFWLGSIMGASQVGAFAVIAIFAIVNSILIREISIKLGAHPVAGTLAALILLFATPAFAYGVTLYQHHISTFLILASIYLLTGRQSVWSLFSIWFLCAASIPIDYPNLFLMAPIGIYALGQIFRYHLSHTSLRLSISFRGLLTLSGLVLPLVFFLWFNSISYGNPMQFSGTVGTVLEIDSSGQPAVPQNETSVINADMFLRPEMQEKSALEFFSSRNLLNGLIIHLFSPDRSILFFTPVILLGIVGLIIASKSSLPLTPVLTGVILANIILYSLWGDPWGGWAFGSRYLIPGYAVLAIFLSLFLTHYSRHIFFLALFLSLAFYSISVNTLGALTSNANPPQVQILELERVSGQVQKYTYARNWDLLKNGAIKSFLYRSYASRFLSPLSYFVLLSGSVSLTVLALTTYLHLSKKHV